MVPILTVSVTTRSFDVATVVRSQTDWFFDFGTIDTSSCDLASFGSPNSETTLELPSGMVTFMFTDIEGSSERWDRARDEMARALTTHNSIFEGHVAGNSGKLVKSLGDGVLAVFADPANAIKAALEAQRAIMETPWDSSIAPIRVRVGIHTGPGEPTNGDYLGPSINRAARLEAAGHGGQVLVSAATKELVGFRADGVGFRNLGEHQLRGLARPESIYQVEAQGLPVDFPPLRTESAPTNLPAPSGEFIGRRSELEEIAAALADARLLTLTGAGGVGKTSLSVEVARHRTHDYPSGVWFFELAPLTDGRHIATEMLGAMRRPASSERPPEDVLLDSLESQRSLLVFDNCEHLRTDVAAIVEAIYRRAENVSILATSREPLGVVGERVWTIPTMGLPSGEDVSQVQESDAGSLFVRRASAADHTFTLDDETAPTVASICRRLDGLPLAIELAAARLRSMSLAELDQRLEDRFRLLRTRASHAVPHHQTLRDTVAWSFDLLEPEDRRLYRRLSIFAGGFDAEAAEAIAGDETDVLEGLDQLVNQSLIEIDRGEQTRYRMLETIRQFGDERLHEEGEHDEVSKAHLAWVLDLTKTGARGIEGRDQAHWLRRFRTEIDNIRVALAWALENDPVTGGSVASALSRFYWMYAAESDSGTMSDSTSFLREGYDWSTSLLEAGGDMLPDLLRGRLQLGIGGLLCIRLGRFDEALERLAEARRIFESHGDERSLGWVTFYEGIAGFGQVDLHESVEKMEKALSLHQAAEDQVGMATSLMLVGLFRTIHDPGSGRPHLEQFAATVRRVGSPLATGHAADSLAFADAIEGSVDEESSELAVEALTTLRKINNYACTCHALGTVSALLARRGDLGGAARALGLADTIRDRLSMAVAPYEEREPYIRDIVGHAATEAPAWAQARMEGRTLEPDEGVDWMIERLGQSPGSGS